MIATAIRAVSLSRAISTTGEQISLSADKNKSRERPTMSGRLALDISFLFFNSFPRRGP